MRLKSILAALTTATVIWIACGTETPTTPLTKTAPPAEAREAEQEPVGAVLAAEADVSALADATILNSNPAEMVYFCYKPSDGSVYRIKADGLEDACKHEKHVEFSFAATDGFSMDAPDGGPADALYVDPEGGVHATESLHVGNTVTITHDPNVIGTGADEPLEFHVGGERRLRLEPPGSWNIIGGHLGNSGTEARWGFIGGGGMGAEGGNNFIRGDFAAIVGGNANEADVYGFVGGGAGNSAENSYAVVSGGSSNTASGVAATVPGGSYNRATGDYSFAAGTQAIAGHEGTFVWADNHSEAFASTAANQFLIRAEGGVGIGTNAPTEMLTVDGTIESTEGGFKFPDGTVQTSAVHGWTWVSTYFEVEPGGFNTSGIHCPEGKLVVGGGFSAPPGTVSHSQPNGPSGWYIEVHNHGTETFGVNGHAVCISGLVYDPD
jgi:hypothetical protein